MEAGSRCNPRNGVVDLHTLGSTPPVHPVIVPRVHCPSTSLRARVRSHCRYGMGSQEMLSPLSSRQSTWCASTRYPFVFLVMYQGTLSREGFVFQLYLLLHQSLFCLHGGRFITQGSRTNDDERGGSTDNPTRQSSLNWFPDY